MGVDIYLPRDLERGIRATVILAVNVCLANGGGNLEHIGGILAHAQAQATLYGLRWTDIVAECKQELGADVGGLLDGALALSDGKRKV